MRMSKIDKTNKTVLPVLPRDFNIKLDLSFFGKLVLSLRINTKHLTKFERSRIMDRVFLL